MASYSKEHAQDAAHQSHTSRLNELWSLPRPAKGLNTNNNNNNNNNNIHCTIKTQYPKKNYVSETVSSLSIIR